MRFLLVLLLGGCAIFLSRTEGFAALVSYGRAAALLAEAKIDQTQERFSGCIVSADKARFYIKESRAGR